MKYLKQNLTLYLCFVGLASGFQTPLFAQNGFPDPGFGTFGEVTTTVEGMWGEACGIVHEVAVQADGKIVAVGSVDDILTLVRYNGDGTIDTEFGVDGIATGTIESDYYFGSALAIQPDGKLVVGSRTIGISDIDFALSRFNSDGSSDTTFGDNGTVITHLDCTDAHVFSSILIQSDGKIIGCGTSFCEDWISDEWKFAVIRYNPDGTLDDTFGGDGIVLDELGFWGTGLNIGYAGALQADGKVVMAGWSYSPTGSGDSFALMRWNTDGTRDTTFGENGGVLLDFGAEQNAIAHALCIQYDGKIVVTGRVEIEVGAPSDFGLARFNSDGEPDTTFGDGGFLVTDFDEIYEDGYTVLQQVDGKLVVSGYMGSDVDNYYKFATIRYNTDGSIDTEFGTDGLVTSDFGNDFSQCFAAALQEDGKIVAGGFTSLDNCTIALARYVSCSAYFTLFPDATPHVWNAVNMAVGSEPISYLWEWGDGTYSTEAYPTHVYVDSGYYTICLTITDGLGCVSTYCDSSTYIYRADGELTMVTINVVNELPSETGTFAADISVAPNPFTEYFTIKIPEETFLQNANNEIKLYDLAGNALLTQQINATETTISTAALPDGVYVLYYSNGHAWGNLKLVKME